MHGYRDLSRLTALLRTSLIAYMVAAVISLWSGWQEIDLLQKAADGGGEVSEADALANDARQGVVALVYLVVFLTTAVLFLRWTHAANRNAHALGSRRLTFTPGWAVGWYFVPLAHLWKPYQALRETFEASDPEAGEHHGHASYPGVLPVWWALWILATVAGYAALRSTLRAETVEELRDASRIMFVADVVDLPLALAALRVVTRLNAWQSEKRRHVVLTGA